MKNVLFVGAHHDDFELAMGASCKRWVESGARVSSAILTNSEWITPDGVTMRSAKEAIAQCENAAKLLGYKPYNLQICRDFELRYDDKIVCELLKIIKTESVDTLITLWPNDAHPTHQIASHIALAATRRVPNVLTAKVSWNASPHAFKPNYFVNVTDHFEAKIQALHFYENEFGRRGKDWERYVTSTAVLNGLESGCELAEGFEVVKLSYS